MRNTKLWMNILLVLIVVYAVAEVVISMVPQSIPPAFLVLTLIAFALLHGALRFRWSGILIFIVICLVVSNILECSSTLRRK